MKILKLKMVTLLLNRFILFFLLLLLPAHAQNDLAFDFSKIVSPLETRLLRAEQKLDSPSELTTRDLESIRDELKQISVDSLDSLLPLKDDFFNLLRRLQNLGPATEGETLAIQLQRQNLLQQKTEIVLAIKLAESISVRAQKHADSILVQLRARFISQLFQQHSLTAETFSQLNHDLPLAFARFLRAFNSWLDFVFTSHVFSFSFVCLLALILSGFFVVLSRRLHRLAVAVETSQAENRLHKILSSFFDIIIPGASFAIVAIVFHFGLLYFNLYRFSMESLVAGFLAACTGLLFASLLLNVILAPFSPAKRLISLPDSAAKNLSLLYFSMAFIFALDFFTGRIFTLFADENATVIAKNIITTLFISLFLVLSLCVRTRPAPATKWHWLLFWPIAFIVLAMLASVLLGFSGLARFISGQIILTGSILAIATLGFRSATALSESGTFATTSLGQNVKQNFSPSDMRLDQFGLLLSIIIRILIVLIILPILALQWGYPLDQIGESSLAILTGFSVGNIEFSFGRIIVAIILFAALIALTKAIQNWVVARVFSRTKLDSGIRNSLRSGLGYVGYFIAGLVGLSATGIQLSNIALVAGALSVGIGFGLQNIVNNFVSGLIMLIERPIKVGDIISVSGFEGYVRKINVRATELETFERQSVIIPNSEVINTAVGNWMHQDAHRRVCVNVGVAYGTDVEKVREILLQVARDHPLIINNDDSFVYFKAFGDSSLDFELRVIIKDINDTLIVENDLRFAIVAAFGEHGIDIPFPQRDIHIKGKTSL